MTWPPVPPYFPNSYQTSNVFLPLFPPAVARVTESFSKWVVVDFQLGYL